MLVKRMKIHLVWHVELAQLSTANWSNVTQEYLLIVRTP